MEKEKMEKEKKEIVLIAAMDSFGLIGINNTLPWNIKTEMNHFSRTTSLTKDPEKKNALIMGRLTFDSMRQKALPNRISVVVSTFLSDLFKPRVVVVQSFEEAVQYVLDCPEIEKAFAVGGASIFQQAMAHPLCRTMILSTVFTTIEEKKEKEEEKKEKKEEKRVYFPAIDLKVWKPSEEKEEYAEFFVTRFFKQ